MEKKPISIFVAMPYSDMGAGAKLKPDKVKTCFRKRWELLRERGLILDKIEGDEHLDGAIRSYRQALELNPSSADLYCCLGGSLRRLGLRQSDDSGRRELLDDSFEQYLQAIRLHRHDSYAGLNTVRLLLKGARRMGHSPENQPDPHKRPAEPPRRVEFFRLAECTPR